MTDPYNGKGRFRWCFELWGENVPLSDVIEHLDEAKKEFPKEAKFPYETTVEARDLKYQSWFRKWFGDEE